MFSPAPIVYETIIASENITKKALVKITPKSLFISILGETTFVLILKK